MPRQIAVRLMVTPYPDRASGLLLIQDVDTVGTLRLSNCSFVLSLGLEPGDDDTHYAQGYIRSDGDGVSYPIRSNRSLYDALRAFVDGAGAQE